MKPLVINAVSAYAEAPAATHVLRENFPLLHEMLPIGEREIYLLIDNKEQELSDKIRSRLGKTIHVILVDGYLGFAYQNSSAAAKVLKGEKPLPGWEDETIQLCSVEKLLNQKYKKVIIDSKNGEPKLLNLHHTVSTEAILSAYGQESPKAICFGYPMSVIMDAGQKNVEFTLKTDYITLIQEDDCILDCLLNIIKQYLDQCCGKCVLGYEGLTQIYTILQDITQKKGKTADIDLITELSQVMNVQALCDIGKSAARVVLSSIEHFHGELTGHITKKTCAAGVCSKYLTYHILQDLCSGCGTCMDACEDDAISGKKKFVHIIDTDECTQCGKCLTLCPNNAIVTAGTIKPKCPKKPVPCKR